MRTTNIPCSSCGELLVDVSGLGDKSQNLICNNTSCLSHYRHINYPQCGSAGKNNIQVLGLGHQRFTCSNCSHQWSSI